MIKDTEGSNIYELGAKRGHLLLVKSWGKLLILFVNVNRLRTTRKAYYEISEVKDLKYFLSNLRNCRDQIDSLSACQFQFNFKYT